MVESEEGSRGESVTNYLSGIGYFTPLQAWAFGPCERRDAVNKLAALVQK